MCQDIEKLIFCTLRGEFSKRLSIKKQLRGATQCYFYSTAGVEYIPPRYLPHHSYFECWRITCIACIYPLQRARLWWASLMPIAKNAANRQPFDNTVGVQQISEMFKVLSARHKQQLSEEARHQVAVDALYKSFGFKLSVQPSILPGAGNGVFLSGMRESGDIVCLYPGTIYMPSEPMLLVSLRNRYILKCIDGLAVDAKSTGLSNRIHSSLHKRDNWPGAIVTSDISWLTKHPINPLAIGQVVNNNKDANVRYQEIDLPSTFPLELRQYIPNLYLTDQSIENDWRIVALIATRKVQDEELFSTYFESVY